MICFYVEHRIGHLPGPWSWAVENMWKYVEIIYCCRIFEAHCLWKFPDAIGVGFHAEQSSYFCKFLCNIVIVIVCILEYKHFYCWHWCIRLCTYVCCVCENSLMWLVLMGLMSGCRPLLRSGHCTRNFLLVVILKLLISIMCWSDIW